LVGKVDVVDGVVDAIHGEDMAAVIAGAEAAQTAAESALAVVEGLNDASAGEVASAVGSSVVDGLLTVIGVLKRLNAFVAGASTRTGTDPITVAFKGEAGQTVLTQTIDVAGGQRTVE
jgi:hypothetical protein